MLAWADEFIRVVVSKCVRIAVAQINVDHRRIAVAQINVDYLLRNNTSHDICKQLHFAAFHLSDISTS